MRIKNGLVMVVILLFIGVAVQPSIAVTPNSSDKEEDCNLCAKKVSKLQELGKFQELSDSITFIKKIIQGLKPDYPYPIICSILGLIIAFMLQYDDILSSIGMFFINKGFNIIPRIVFAVLIIPVPIILIPAWGLFVLLCIPGWPDFP